MTHCALNFGVRYTNLYFLNNYCKPKVNYFNDFRSFNSKSSKEDLREQIGDPDVIQINEIADLQIDIQIILQEPASRYPAAAVYSEGSVRPILSKKYFLYTSICVNIVDKLFQTHLQYRTKKIVFFQVVNLVLLLR